LPVPAADQLAAEIQERDAHDAGRAVAPLCRADDAVELVSDGLAIEAVVHRIVDLFRERVPVEAMVSPGDGSPAG
jgi:pantoate ligase/cytidylate kinase